MKELNRLLAKEKKKSKRRKKQRKQKPRISAYKKKYLDYLQSPEWAVIRIEMLEHYNYTCSRCHQPFNSHKLQVHHKTYKNIFNEEPEDLELVCITCHKKEHKIK